MAATALSSFATPLQATNSCLTSKCLRPTKRKSRDGLSNSPRLRAAVSMVTTKAGAGRCWMQLGLSLPICLSTPIVASDDAIRLKLAVGFIWWDASHKHVLDCCSAPGGCSHLLNTNVELPPRINAHVHTKACGHHRDLVALRSMRVSPLKSMLLRCCAQHQHVLIA
jgi:hypothetical protein